MYYWIPDCLIVNGENVIKEMNGSMDKTEVWTIHQEKYSTNVKDNIVTLLI